MLAENKSLPRSSFQSVWENKQKATIEMFDKLDKDHELIGFFETLSKLGIKIAVASNSIRNTVKIILLRLGLLEFVDFFASNEDVSLKKPHPEMY